MDAAAVFDAETAYDDVRAALTGIADPVKGAGMRRYMRDLFPYFGVTTPERRAATRTVIRSARRASSGELLGFARRCWAAPERELQYVASDALKEGRTNLGPDDLAALRGLITTKSWWDTVDSLASPTVGSLVERDPALASVMDEWVDSDDIWVARTAIIHQLRFKERTDGDRLFAYALRRSADTEFFIRKAIGWALREYSKTAPDDVAAFVDEHEAQLSGLTVREARKHLARLHR